MRKIKIALASKSPVKQAVCAAIFNHLTNVEIVIVPVGSDVPEQPFNQQAKDGALNRAENARAACPDADMVVAIENGIFEEDGIYVDKGIVAIMTKGMTREDAVLECSDGVAFDQQVLAYKDGAPLTARDAVLEAGKREGGYGVWTAGKVMAEWQPNLKHDDPHKYLTGGAKSRVEYLEDALRKAVANPKAKLVLG